MLPLAQSEAGAAPPAAVPRCLPWQRDRGGRAPAPAQVAPAGSLPHAGPFLRLGGAGARSQRSQPGPRSPRVLQETEKPRRETRISPTPPAWGGGTAPRALPRGEPNFPHAPRRTRGAAPSPLRSLASPSPALQATRGEGEQPRRLAAAPLRLGRHVRASQSRLQVGIHHGLTVRGLDVVGGFLELQQHGHLRGEARGTQPNGDRGGLGKEHPALLALPNRPHPKKLAQRGEECPGMSQILPQHQDLDLEDAESSACQSTGACAPALHCEPP